MTIDEFVTELAKLGIEITDEQLKMLEEYYKLLIEWNEKINLTAITEKKSVYLKHFYDSLTLNKIINLNKITSMCDIGTGAGFPGIVIKILFPNINITLVDSLNKRINFLKEVINKLKLNKIEAIHARAEEYAKDNREKYDLVTARAVAPLNILLEYSIPIVKTEKYFVAMKGNNTEEIKNISHALNELKCTIDEKIEFELFNNSGHRTLIKIKKISSTPLKYPRSNSDIKKKGL